MYKYGFCVLRLFLQVALHFFRKDTSGMTRINLVILRYSCLLSCVHRQIFYKCCLPCNCSTVILLQNLIIQL